MSKLRVDKIAGPIIKDEYTGSVYFDGTGDYLSMSDSTDFDLGISNEPFTWELWFYKTAAAGTHCELGVLRGGGTAGWNATNGHQYRGFQYTDNKLYWQWWNGSTNINIISSTTPAINTWHHFAVSYDGTTTRAFLNGVVFGTSTEAYAKPSASNITRIGQDPSNSVTTQGYHSNVRVCKGHAVYTGNFTPPTRELEVHTGAKGVVFPAADNRTVLLACQDAYNPLTEATGRHTITGAGNLGGVPGQELVENGDFASSLDNWTASGVQFSHTTNNVGGNTSGKLMYYATGANTSRNIYQDVPTVSGARYVLSFDSSSDTASANTIDIAGTSVYTLEDNNNTKLIRTEVGFTASSSTTRIRFTSTVSNRAYLDNVSVVAVTPNNEANPGLLRKTNTTSTITETTGSVYFDGNGDYFSVGNASDADWAFGTDPFTVEHWIYWQSVGNGQLLSPGMGNETNAWYWQYYNSQLQWGAQGVASDLTYSFTPNANRWYHIAVSRDYSQKMRFFIDGVEVASGTVSRNYVASASPLLIANGGAGHFQGYMSNVRVCKGHAVYTSNFIPPTRELEVHPGPDDDRTVFLGLYDGENIFAEKTGRHIIAVYGDRPSSTTWTSTDTPVGSTVVTPGLTREVDPVEGPTFGGGAGFVSQNWLTLPKGTTTERMPVLGGDQSGTRGFFAGAYSPTRSDVINYVTVPTLGNAIDFGNLGAANGGMAGFSDNTRGWTVGGNIAPARTNVMEYVTMASSGNAIDGGDLITATQARPGSVANSIRGIVAGGATPGQVKTIVHHTIQTTGIVQNFGDLTEAKQGVAGVMSPTRGVFAGGKTPSLVDTIEYVTMASTGNAVLFGELSLDDRAQMGGASNTVRGLFGGGRTPSALSHIEYVTIATLGDAVDFGDLTQSQMNGDVGAVSNSTRVVFGGGGSDELGHVEIATLGNTTQFGKFTVQTTANQDPACFSSGHGGLG